MKILISFLVASCLLSGCMTTGSTVPHDDSAAATPREAGPTLCRDGTVPPCNPRD
jgi:hypothetical protein